MILNDIVRINTLTVTVHFLSSRDTGLTVILCCIGGCWLERVTVQTLLVSTWATILATDTPCRALSVTVMTVTVFIEPLVPLTQA